MSSRTDAGVYIFREREPPRPKTQGATVLRDQVADKYNTVASRRDVKAYCKGLLLDECHYH